MTRWLQRITLTLLTLALLLAAVAMAALWWGQERLLFAPQTLAAEHRFDFGADVHEGFIDVPGARLNTLHLKLPAPRGVVFFLHGNGGNLQSWFVNADFYRRANIDLFMLDYRGYGKSTGHISSEAQLHADVRAAWDQVAPQYAGKKRVVYGRSLGSGLAAALAAEVQPEQLILVSPYESMLALAADHYAFVPAWLQRYPLRTDLALPRVAGAVLLMHGERDTLIKPQHSERLQAAVPRVQLLRIAGAAHNDLQQFDSYLQALRSALLQ
jgi:uncharacterized protein